jgi:hypothetical protein
MLDAMPLLGSAIAKVPDISNVLAGRQARIQRIECDSLAYMDGSGRKTEVDDWLRYQVYLKGSFGLANFASGGYQHIEYYLVAAAPLIAVTDSEARNCGAITHAPAIYQVARLGIH